MFRAGNQEWRKRQVMTDAMRIELVQYQALEKQIKAGEAPRAIARRAIEAAIAGEPWAIAFVYDRMDGKSVQRTENKHEHSVAETITEEHARLVAEGFLDSLRGHPSDGSKEPDRIHDGSEAGLPGGKATP